MVCGDNLIYSSTPEPLVCHFCGVKVRGTISCANKHFVCDACHGIDALDAIRYYALHTTSDNPVDIAGRMMSHPSMPIIGGEHHAVVAASLIAALKNGGPVSYNGAEILVNDDLIERALDRTWTDRMPSCMCANYGACGAGLAAGAVISLLADATCDPTRARQRQVAMQTTNKALAEIAAYEGTCCKLSTRIAIETARRAVNELTGVEMPNGEIVCSRSHKNPYRCLGSACPYFA